MRNRIATHLLLFVLSACSVSTANAADRQLSFGVVPQRSVILTAQYWNPILKYLEKKSGVPLVLKVEKTAPEHSRQVGLGRYDLVYTNHFFTKANARAGYRVVARPAGPAITGEIVVPEGSPIARLEDLAGREVGFPSPAAFVAYAVPLDVLTRKGIRVKPVFAGNQEGIMAQLKAGRVAAAGVNSQVMQSYANREGWRYRSVWQSPEYLNLPIAVHPRVAAGTAAAIVDALVNMSHDPEGVQILEKAGALIGQQPPYGFVPASNREYRNQWEFFKQTVVPESR
ncbi:phosphate/phosphite/phosphonate ABC transporter substrate-binding protein [Trichlorobacter lovleyi]|uniref:phosphate/phosphite/phosphonate ABC transporter substrate-binding protein n=1 Tax=Trichlorobacter lovleyi TaxID=313985 RepID=UPI002240428B|nr:phosphate/phosphite/phosphonate ABC transporter substrate-binding protein [Trichlorobacter lovleyi]QOX77783.1 phosphate/phosphite/phosphonate ABC transporter substrate-binding protein [Trichlorobacter lovleyi]